MGLYFYYYDGLQPKMSPGIINEHECIWFLKYAVWTANEVLSRSIPSALSWSIPSYWGYGSTQLYVRFNSRHHWMFTSNVISKFYFLKVGGYCEAMLDVTKNILLTFKGICMNFSLELNFFTQWPQNSLIKSFRSLWLTLYRVLKLQIVIIQ